MPKRSDLKSIAIVMIGVMAAGYAMSQLSNVAVVAQSRDGFGA